MEDSFIEASYSIDFRADDARVLGEHIRHGHSVDLVGMKKVGISNFLRFFLYQRDIVKTYINGNGQRHVFIRVDLNDLIEREMAPFWILTFKRIVDKTEDLPLDVKTKKLISRLFLDSIQSKDIFLTFDSIRRSLREIVKANILPTIFFLRFDRLKDSITPEFLDNLQGLKDATAQKLSYVFTSFRTLNDLAPNVFKKEDLSVFSQNMYIKPAEYTDIKIIFNTFKEKYQLSVDEKTQEKILNLSGGHVQYLQLSLIILKELTQTPNGKNDIENTIIKDERINLQSEELWETLTGTEKDILLRILKGEKMTEDEKQKGKYLWETGIVNEKNGKKEVFSPIFNCFLKDKNGVVSSSSSALDFTKKENLLFIYLKENLENLCDRERIIETVWSEYEELGISDWAVDRLVARVRTKLKNTNCPYQIVTVKTRGYKLVQK